MAAYEASKAGDKDVLRHNVILKLDLFKGNGS